MHQIIFAVEGAIELEYDRGNHLIPRQLAAWIPAGTLHRASFRRIRSGSVFFPREMVACSDARIRTVIPTGLMRAMMHEAMRWPIDGEASRLRAVFYDAMAALCSEWIEHEADLFLPMPNDPRLQRALQSTSSQTDMTLTAVCAQAGISERSLRRHLKAETGLSWQQYRYRARLLQAVSMLSETDTPIGQIASICGFAGNSAFAKAFRLAVGETPRAYRDRIRDHG